MLFTVTVGGVGVRQNVTVHYIGVRCEFLGKLYVTHNYYNKFYMWTFILVFIKMVNMKSSA